MLFVVCCVLFIVYCVLVFGCRVYCSLLDRCWLVVVPRCSLFVVG